MTVIKSNHTADLPLPKGPVVRAGKSIEVANWGMIKGHDIVKSWLAAGAIEEVAVEEPKSKASKSKSEE